MVRKTKTNDKTVGICVVCKKIVAKYSLKKFGDRIEPAIICEDCEKNL